MGISEPAEHDLWECVHALPDKQRAAVAYRYLADLPCREIGRLLGSSEAAARRSASDGIANLRLVLEKLRDIAYGSTASYRVVAAPRADRPRCSAVGNCLRAQPAAAPGGNMSSPVQAWTPSTGSSPRQPTCSIAGVVRG